MQHNSFMHMYYVGSSGKKKQFLKAVNFIHVFLSIFRMKPIIMDPVDNRILSEMKKFHGFIEKNAKHVYLLRWQPT